MSRSSTPSGLIARGTQRIVTNSTAVGLNTTTIKGSSLIVSVEAKAARIVFDASTPTANTGVLLTTTGQPYRFDGIDGSKVKIARAVSGAIVTIASFGRSQTSP